jgi:Kef-type K+ transport system membrane component KefB
MVDWDPGKQSLSIIESLKRKSLVTAFALTEILMILIYFYSVPSIVSKNRHRPNIVVLTLLVAVSMAFVLSIHIGAYVYRRELVNFMNGFIGAERETQTSKRSLGYVYVCLLEVLILKKSEKSNTNECKK